MSKIKLEVGKWYKTRKGNKAQVLHNMKQGTIKTYLGYEIFSSGDESASTWSECGHFNCVQEKTQFDIVEEIDAKPEQMCIEEKAKPKKTKDYDCHCDSRHLATIGHEHGCAWGMG